MINELISLLKQAGQHERASWVESIYHEEAKSHLTSIKSPENVVASSFSGEKITNGGDIRDQNT